MQSNRTVGVQVTPPAQNKLLFFDIKEKQIMNTQLAFAFGMLAMVAIGMIITLVVGMLKVSNLEAELKDTQDSITKHLGNIERHLSDMHRELEQRIDKESRYVEITVSEHSSVLHRRIDETQSQIDSRFDKFENKITKKQILND